MIERFTEQSERGEYRLDRKRYASWSTPLRDHCLRFVWMLRKAQRSRNPLWRLCLHRMRERYGLEIYPETIIGPGLYLGHGYGITVNAAAVIGRNVNLHKGVTVGQENRGKRKGVPTIGNSVWIGANSTVVGAVSVGDDVLIAPNTYVNCDIPSHSIVIGSPCRISSRLGATDEYVNRRV